MKDKQLCVLAIDDSTDILELIKFSLEAQTKWKVLVSNSSHEGLSQAHKELPDIILSDLCMPKMDGIEMVEQLRFHSKTKDIPVCLITSLPDLISSKKLNQLGISQVIGKPLEAIILPDLIESVLNST